MILRWFASKTVRQAVALGRHVRKLLNHQRDLLAPKAIEAVQGALDDLKTAIRKGAGKAELEKQGESLEKTAQKWLKPYPHHHWRENVEVLLVALAVAMGIRTFFLQPFKIPTGSMQPTLYGVTSTNLLHAAEFKIPTGMERVREWFAGISYVDVVAGNDGVLNGVSQPVRFLIFNIKQTIYIGGQPHTIWFPPDYGSDSLNGRAQLTNGQLYAKGDQVVLLKVASGDHLFVDRLTYNFRPPERGEIIVFETRGIPADFRDPWQIAGDQFYIKRLVGLGGERIEIGEDRHLVIDGRRLDASLPHFENLYSFNPRRPPTDSHYSGHVSAPNLAYYFLNRPEGVKIPEEHLMVMGDNTMSSLDSRAWGSFPAKYVIGKSFFVYWPITQRFGWGYHR
jgi:signal peptidase I